MRKATTFTERSPPTATREIARRRPQKDSVADYDLAAEQFVIYVPQHRRRQPAKRDLLILLANFPLGGGLAVIGVMMSDRQSSSVGIAVGNQDMVVADRVMLDTEDAVGTTNDLRLVIRKCSGHASGMTRESHASHSPQTNAQHAIDELRL